MKSWMTFAFTWGTIALLFDSVKAEPELDGVCDVLNSITPEGKALSTFNAVFFGDFITGKNANVMGPLAVKGTITGENALINSKKTTSCSPIQEDEFEHHGLILGGANASPITVNGFAYLQNNSEDSKIMTPLEECENNEPEINFDFDKVQNSAMEMSRKLAGMLPNWSIDADGVIVNMVSEGVNADQPFNLFAMPACTMGTCKALNYFDCGEDEDCEAPAHMLSNVDSMFLGKGEWNGPVEESYPNSEMVVFNIPVLNQHTFDIQSKNPSMGLNACNTLYNFYAVDEEGKYAPEGHFTIKRSTTEPLGGMVLAPQAHILDDTQGSFSGQVIAASYEAIGDDIIIKDYVSSGNNQCQSFQGCLTSANKSLEDEIAELEANDLEENGAVEEDDEVESDGVEDEEEGEEEEEEGEGEDEDEDEGEGDEDPEDEVLEEDNKEAVVPEEEAPEEVPQEENAVDEEELQEDVPEDDAAEEEELQEDDAAEEEELQEDDTPEGDAAEEEELQEDDAPEGEIPEGMDEESEANDIFGNGIFEENEEPWNNIVQYAEDEVSDSVNVDEVSVSDVFGPGESSSAEEHSENGKHGHRSKKHRKGRKEHGHSSEYWSSEE